MTPITSAWPSSQWGIDIVGPLPIAPGGARFGILQSTTPKQMDKSRPPTETLSREWKEDWGRLTKVG
ncbi:hypothetical protein Tco_0883568 [Tanacetum coccineum]